MDHGLQTPSELFQSYRRPPLPELARRNSQSSLSYLASRGHGCVHDPKPCLAKDNTLLVSRDKQLQNLGRTLLILIKPSTMSLISSDVEEEVTWAPHTSWNDCRVYTTWKACLSFFGKEDNVHIWKRTEIWMCIWEDIQRTLTGFNCHSKSEKEMFINRIPR